MPSNPPPLSDPTQSRLGAIGECIRRQRKQKGVSATTAAEAAGMSRVTWHRIERGEPSVTIGAYMNAAQVLGATLAFVDPTEPIPERDDTWPVRIRIADFPELQRLGWQLATDTELTPQQAFDLYERNWRHVDRASLSPPERNLITTLAGKFGPGRVRV